MEPIRFDNNSAVLIDNQRSLSVRAIWTKPAKLGKKKVVFRWHEVL
jgi:hypothetical protein